MKNNLFGFTYDICDEAIKTGGKCIYGGRTVLERQN